MKISKSNLLLGSVTFTVVLVYGIGLLTTFIKGEYVLANGLMDKGYVLAVLSIAVPLVLYILFANGKYEKHSAEVVLIVVACIFCLYAAVYFTSFYEQLNDQSFSADKMNKLAFIFLCVSFLTVSTVHVAVASNDN